MDNKLKKFFNKDVTLKDVTPLSLLYEDPISGEYISIIEAQTQIPISKTISIKFMLENKSSVQLNIFQGEINWGKKNRPVARIHLDNIPHQKSIAIKYEFTFLIDAGGILSITANDNETGKSQNIKIQAFEGLLC